MGITFFLAFLATSLCAQNTVDQKKINPNEKSQCLQEKGSAYQWDNRRNLCVLKKTSSEGREAFQKCQSMSDPDKKKACFEENRNRLVGKDAVVIEDPLAGKLSTITASVPMAFFVVNALTTRAGLDHAGCLSKKIFKGAAIAGVGAEAYLKLMASRKFKNLQKEYESLKETDPYSMQVAAFKFLEDQQKEVASLAGRQKKIYKVLSISYVSSASIAALESATLLGLNPCPVTGDLTSPAVEGPGLSKLINLLGHSPGIVIVSGVMTALYKVLAEGAAKEEKKSLERAEIAKEKREQFEQMYTSAGFCSSREDRRIPNCYCYTNEGKRNSLRTSSETCKKLWAFHDRNLFVAANNLDVSSLDNFDRKGCVDRKQKFDADCKCLKIVDEKGENSCYKTLITSESLQELPSGEEAVESLKDLNQITNGRAASESLGGPNLNKRAAQADFRLKNILDKQESIHKQKGLPSIKKTLGSLNSSFKRHPPKLNLTSGFSAFKGTAKPFTPKNLAANIDKSLKGNKDLKKAFTLNNTTTGPAKRNTKVKSPFNESATKAPKIMGNFMKKDYDYSKSQDEITDIKERSLWKIISGRYIQTGLERLFED